jgi:hypothetical protein
MWVQGCVNSTGNDRLGQNSCCTQTHQFTKSEVCSLQWMPFHSAFFTYCSFLWIYGSVDVVSTKKDCNNIGAFMVV